MHEGDVNTVKKKYALEDLKPDPGAENQTFVAKDEPGRNDPCRCGSGEKYKYCCLHDEKRHRVGV